MLLKKNLFNIKKTIKLLKGIRGVCDTARVGQKIFSKLIIAKYFPLSIIDKFLLIFIILYDFI